VILHFKFETVVFLLFLVFELLFVSMMALSFAGILRISHGFAGFLEIV
jgi:hypothetical protein